MRRLVLAKHVAAPPAKVFAAFTDLDEFAGRIASIVRVERLTPGPVGRGTRFRETRVMFKREATETMEFRAFEAGRSYTLGCLSCGMDYAFSFRFTAAAGGTDVIADVAMKPVTFFARLLSPLAALMAGPLRKCLAQDLEDVAASVEGRAPAKAAG